MKTKCLAILLLPLLVALTSCDLIEGPKVDPSAFPTTDNKVLIEDFTGHRCGFCPSAHVIADGLKAQYGDKAVVIAVHASGHAIVVPSIGYGYDFRTTLGADLESYYRGDALRGYPVGLIQRRNWGGTPLVDKLEWGSRVAAVLGEAPKMDLNVSATYDSTTREVQVEADLEYYTTGTADHRIVVVVTEDSIIAKQTNYSVSSGVTDDYVHNHVLRGTITPGSWGLPLKSAPIVLGEKFDLTFTGALKQEWVAKQCHIVVYVHDMVTREIIQVEEIKLMP